MTILRCVDPNAGNSTSWESTQEVWFTGSIILIVFFFALVLFGIIPIFKYWNEFKTLSALNISARICFTVALFLKMISHICSFIKWNNFCSAKTLRILGYLFFSLPSYFITTCYTLVLMSWLVICMQILPMKIVNIFKKGKVCLIVYNVIIYICVIVSLVIECIIEDPISEKHVKLNLVSGYFEIGRDIILFIVFMLFVILLQLGLGDDAFTESSIEQKKLFWLVIILAVLVLGRGIIGLTQVIIGEKTECSIGFFVAFCANEVIIEGIPLFVLLKINNGFLGTRRNMACDLTAVSLLSET